MSANNSSHPGVTTVSNATLEAILRKHTIATRDWPAMQALVHNGAPQQGVGLSLEPCRQLQGALRSILIELSKKVKYKFPPRDWKLSSRKAS